MASISESGGLRTIQFKAPDGKRKSIRMGRAPAKAVDAVKLKVEALVASKLANIPIDSETARWVGQVDATLAKKLAKAGLIDPRADDLPESVKNTMLEPFLKGYIDGRTDYAPNSRQIMDQ